MFDKLAAQWILGLKTWDDGISAITWDDGRLVIAQNTNLMTGVIAPVIGNIAYDLLVVSGVVTMFVMVIGGIMYVTSSGSPDKVAKAHGTISGGLIGALISISASQIVGFVMSQVNPDSSGETVGNIMGTLYFLVGALSTVMIIYGGLSYMIASGDEGKVKKAKQTIIWACVGLAVALGAWAITEFVLTKVAP